MKTNDQDLREARRKLVVKSALREVKLEDVQTDPSYQRDVKKKHEQIVANFNPTALGIPVVGEREDGTLWWVDGLQRGTALLKLGKKTVRAEVFRSDGPEHEAKVFKLINLNRTKLNSREEFRSLLAGQDELAWKIKNAVEKLGYKIVLGRGTSATRETQATYLQGVNTMYKGAGKYGVAALEFALSTIKEAWPGDVIGSTHLIIGGLMMFWKAKDGVVDNARLIPRLQTVTPHQIIYTAGLTVSGNNKQGAVVHVIEKLYKKVLRRKI
jgi:hypothetical protein